MKRFKFLVIIGAVVVLATSCADLSEQRRSRDGRRNVQENYTSDDRAYFPSESTISDDADASSFSSGEVSGRVYTNEYMGIRFEAPVGWTVDYTGPRNSDEALTLLESGTELSIFHAESSSEEDMSFSTFDLTVETIESLNLQDMADHGMDADALEVVLVANAEDSVMEIIESYGCTDAEYSEGTIDFLDSSYPQLTVTSDMTDEYTVTVTIVCVVKDDYVLSFTAACLSADTDNMIQEILGRVTPI